SSTACIEQRTVTSNQSGGGRSVRRGKVDRGTGIEWLSVWPPPKEAPERDVSPPTHCDPPAVRGESLSRVARSASFRRAGVGRIGGDQFGPGRWRTNGSKSPTTVAGRTVTCHRRREGSKMCISRFNAGVLDHRQRA